MTTTTYGTKAQLDANQHLGTIITNPDLNKLLDAISTVPDHIFTVADSDGSTSVGNNGYDVLLVNDELATSNDLDSRTPNDFGGFDGIGGDATVVDNASGAPIEIFATKSAYIELTGPATVAGGTAHTLIVDASSDTSGVSLTASAQANSYSWLVGGSGSDTLTGSASATGKAVLGSPNGGDTGPTTMNGGAGAVTMYGGGHTTITAGDHAGSFLTGSSASTMSGAGQALYDYTYGAHDSMAAGSGGYNTLYIAHGAGSVIDDTRGNGTDNVYAGGNDTIYGSAHGTAITLQGSSSVQSAGADTIFVNSGANSDTITAGSSTDTVTFQGYKASDVQALVTAQENSTGSTNVTIDFSKLGGTGQTATLNNVTKIHFLDGK